MQVYALARYINREKEIIPVNIIDKAPSAELRPNQKDSDSLPDYAILDRILYQYIERRQGRRRSSHRVRCRAGGPDAEAGEYQRI